MKKLFYIFISICSLFIIMASCENKWPKNGDLDGMWQIMDIQHNGQHIYTYDEDNPPVDSEIHYISFQLNMFQLTTRNERKIYFGCFTKEDNILRLYHISYSSKNETEDDNNILVSQSSIEKIIPWGLYETDNTFNILKLSENKLTVQNDSARIELRKF